MRTNETRWNILAAMMMAMLMMVGAGCATGDESSETFSGDPEADRRAEMRMGSERDKDKKGDKAETRTLYERLGGQRAIAALVDDMTERVIADPRVNFERRNVSRGLLRTKYKPWESTPDNVATFKQRMVEFLSLATGGPTEYTGRDMHTVHADMHISNSEFDAMVGDIKASMDKLNFSTSDKRDLLAIIETTRKQIVEER